MRTVRPIPPSVLAEIYRDDPPAPDTPPSWLVIVPAWIAGLGLICLVWSF